MAIFFLELSKDYILSAYDNAASLTLAFESFP